MRREQVFYAVQQVRGHSLCLDLLVWLPDTVQPQADAEHADVAAERLAQLAGEMPAVLQKQLRLIRSSQGTTSLDLAI